MHSPSSQILMRKGKRGAAVYVQSECSRTTDPQHLKDLLSTLLNPQKPIEELETVDWIKWLIAGGKTPVEFSSIVRRYDNGTTCGLVWTANFVAYRCRTCGISPCMSLCAECFQKGNHEGHDFNMFRSQAGGACDCGDTSVMKEAGFCERHGPHAHIGKPILPPELLAVSQAVMPLIILRLIQHLRSHSIPDILEDQLQSVQDADCFITMLHDYSGMGAAMRHVMTSALINPQLYAQLTEIPSVDSEYAQFMKEAQRMYEKSLKSLPGPEPPDEYKAYPALQDSLVHRTFLEELVFWTVKFEFPQKLVCLLLNMLPDPDYKEAFTRAFVLHYARISRLLVGSSDPDTLSNRVVHVSVQLFSNEELATKMAEELHLLHVMVVSLRDMMSKILVPSTLQDAKKNFHFVVDCSKHVMRDHCYWPLVSDLSNLLSHRPVALLFLSDDSLLEMWFSFLSMFQGMNVNQRELSTHVEFEPNTYYAAFSAELEAPASAMWALAIHLRDTGSVHLTKMLLKHCLAALEEWLEAINFKCPEQTDPYQVSFHIPLHRYLAAFTCQAVRAQGILLKDALPPASLLQLIMMHPLRIQAAFYEILSGLWVRNGLQIKGQAMSYIQCHFGNSMVDADIYLLQICATQLSPTFVLPIIFERFHAMELLSMNPLLKSNFLEGEQEAAMLESCLTFIASLMSIRTNIGANESDLDRLEMVSLLCMSDRTHSQLMELLPEKCGAPQNKDFDAILAQVADYKAPNFEASGSMQQGMYVPKAVVWEQLYDPIYVLLRAVHRRDFQTSMDRFTQYVRQSGLYPSYSSGTLWPPFRLPIATHPNYEDPRKLLLSRTFHAMLFVLLYKAINAPTLVSEQSLALVIYLLDMAVSLLHQSTTQGNEVCIREPIVHLLDDRVDLQLSEWFSTDNLVENVITVVNNVTLATSTAVVANSTEAAELDLESSASSASSTSEGESSDQDMDLDVPEASGGNVLLALPETDSLALVPVVSSRSVVSSDVAAMSVYRNPSRIGNSSHFRVMPALSAVNQASMVIAGAISPTPALAQLPYSNIRAITAGNEVTKYTNQISVDSNLSDTSPGMSTIQYDEGPESDNQHERLCVRESIISLLLRLHSSFSGHSDSYRLPQSLSQDTDAGRTADEDGRIGNGAFWIGKVLDKLSRTDPRVRQAIISTKLTLWPPRTAEDRLPSETADELREKEKKRKIKERQQRLLQEFATKQKQFMQQAMAAEDVEMDLEANAMGSTSSSAASSEATACQSSGSSASMPKPSSAADSFTMHSSYPTTNEGSSSEEYDCVICNQASPSTSERPMCLVVLLQATSVLAHKRSGPCGSSLALPVCEEDRFNLDKVDSLHVEMSRRVENLRQHFDESSWLTCLNIGYEGGVYVHTCGHYLHLDCHKQYLQSLRSQQRQQSLNVERGEYSCPLCRQLANSALPIATKLYGSGRGRPHEALGVVSCLTQASEEVKNMFASEPSISPHLGSNLMEAMGRVMEDMTNATFPHFRQITSTPSPASLFLFVQSIARTNLEIELMQRGDSIIQSSGLIAGSSGSSGSSGSGCASLSSAVSNMNAQVMGETSPTPGASSASWISPGLELRFSSSPTPGASSMGSSSQSVSHSTSPWSLLPKRSCLLPLLHVLATHSKILNTRSYQHTWSRIAGIDHTESFSHSLARTTEMDVPLLIQDVPCLLIQMVLVLPLPVERRHFVCLVQRLFNLTMVQIVTQLSCRLGEKKRKAYKTLSLSDWNIAALMSFIISKMEDVHLYRDEESDVEFNDNSALNVEGDIQQPLYKMALHFLRIACLLQFHLFGDSLPSSGISHTDHEEFVELCSYLNISYEMKIDTCLAPNAVIGYWCHEFGAFLANSRSLLAANDLLMQHRQWRGPRLLTLPNSYDTLFKFYHHKSCPQCKSVPKEPSLCLVCGALVCLRENCCKEENVHEAVQHSIDCGAGTAIFLAINSSTIIVIRGKRACLWGSVYLDAFGEEDRELKRGKPLYLSKDRYALLESQWLSHRFDHTSKKWIWHRDVL
uniref:E3 ubiquitin-protein ligase n=1 Tax=Daphnia magna TaxID=35525 RepID=A0A0N8E404_9CRUS